MDQFVDRAQRFDEIRLCKNAGQLLENGFLLATFELLFAGLTWAGQQLGIGNWLSIAVGSPLVIYLNVIFAKTYDYFFLEIDG